MNAPPPRNPGRRREPDPYDGILLVDKPSGPTSHDVVARIRRHFGFLKVGHGGTLDPMATGLLLIMVGRGTKLSEQVMGSDKAYEGTMHLGVSTNTQDLDGAIVAEKPFDSVSREAVEEQMRKRTGDIMQTPPMVSAIKQNGVPLYKLARKGKTVEREARLLHIYYFDLLAFEPPRARFRLACTKGTYVRTLCADIGDELGCGAFLEALRRTRSGDFSVERATPLAVLLEHTRESVGSLVLPMHSFQPEGPG